MSSRSLLVALLLSSLSLCAVAQPAGHHAVRLGFWAGHVDFSEELNFDSDQAFGVYASAQFTDWVELSVALGQMTMRDHRRDVWSDSVAFDMQWRFLPLEIRRARGGALLGVSFTGFEEDEFSDAVAEGLDLGLALNWGATERWGISLDAFWRMQSFNLLPRDSQGNIIGNRLETGYIWTQILRLGVGHAF